MKYLILTTISALLIGCSSNRYMLSDKGKDKKYLIEYIDRLNKEGKITDKPLVVIDGLAFSYENLKVNKIRISKSDISRMDYLGKNSEGAKNIYGDQGNKGVILILTNNSPQQPGDSLSEGKILFLIGERQITQQELESIDPNEIESIEVVKEKNKVREYTSDNYDGVIIVTMKKK